jgi:hypothetical protein
MFVPRRLRQRTFADTTAPSVSRPAGPRRTSSCRSAITSPPMSSRARRATPPVQVGGAAAGRRDPRLGWRGNRVTAAAPNSIGTVLRDFLNWALFPRLFPGGSQGTLGPTLSDVGMATQSLSPSPGDISGLMSSGSTVGVSIRRHGAVIELHQSGELDVVTAPRLQEAIASLRCCRGPRASRSTRVTASASPRTATTPCRRRSGDPMASGTAAWLSSWDPRSPGARPRWSRALPQCLAQSKPDGRVSDVPQAASLKGVASHGAPLTRRSRLGYRPRPRPPPLPNGRAAPPRRRPTTVGRAATPGSRPP